MKALDDYEAFQRACFETLWINKLDAGAHLNEMRERRSEIGFEMEGLEDGVHRRRLNAELNAIVRVLEEKEPVVVPEGWPDR